MIIIGVIVFKNEVKLRSKLDLKLFILNLCKFNNIIQKFQFLRVY